MSMVIYLYVNGFQDAGFEFGVGGIYLIVSASLYTTMLLALCCFVCKACCDGCRRSGNYNAGERLGLIIED